MLPDPVPTPGGMGLDLGSVLPHLEVESRNGVPVPVSSCSGPFPVWSPEVLPLFTATRGQGQRPKAGSS